MSRSNRAIADGEEEEEARPGLLSRVESHIQGTTVSGLFELVPLIVTAIVLVALIGYADGAVRGLPFVEDQPWDFWGFGLIVFAAIFYAVGIAITTRPGRVLMDSKDTALNHIPVVRTVFGVTKQAMVSMTSRYVFNRVVFVEWPREGMVAMGFVTGRAFAADSDESLVIVYIPTVPNPTSGNMALINEDDVFETDLTVEDAMKLVFSGGIVLPDALSLARVPVERQEFTFVGRFDTAGE